VGVDVVPAVAKISRPRAWWTWHTVTAAGKAWRQLSQAEADKASPDLADARRTRRAEGGKDSDGRGARSRMAGQHGRGRRGPPSTRRPQAPWRRVLTPASALPSATKSRPSVPAGPENGC